MNKLLLSVAVVACSYVGLSRDVSSLDGVWDFRRTDGPTPVEWSKVEVPHDWAIEGPFDATLDGATGKLPWRGTGEYRRKFAVSAATMKTLREGGRLVLDFGGVMARPKVYVNGVVAGGWDYGYMSFSVDAGAFVKEGDNELVVTCDTRAHQSRWYPGAGIFRSVRLTVLPACHLVPGGTFVTTPLVDAKAGRAVVNVAFEIAGGRVADVTLKDPSGKAVASAKGVSPLSFDLEKPALWSPETPALYTCEVRIGDDAETVRFGVRALQFTGRTGFQLNGRRYQLKGVNLHSDLGPLGLAFNKSAMRRQLAVMKDMGANAVRTSHNAPATEMLDLCDEMGFVVWDECFDKWNETSGRYPGENLEEFVTRNLKAFARRDRNHPSVALYSIGNEIWTDKTNRVTGTGMTADRCRLFREALKGVDPTRQVAAGCSYLDAIELGVLDPLDVVGFNYQEQYKFVHARNADQATVYSESASAFSTAGFFENPPAKDRLAFSTNEVACSGYDHTAAKWSDIPDLEFYRMERDRYCAGEFVWTGIDYIGEPSPYDKASRSSYFGIADLMAFPKDRYWLYRSHWNKEAFTLHVLPHWNWEGTGATNVPVYVYTSADSAELFVNGKSMGRRAKRRVKADEVNEMREGLGVKCIPADDFRTNPYYNVTDQYRLRWLDVPYEPGEIKVVAYKGNKAVGEKVVRTAGAPAKVVLASEADELPADGESVVFVRVSLADRDGNPIPESSARVSFKLDGPGRIVAVGNADERGMDSFKAVSSHPLFHGRAGVVVRRDRGAAGRIVLTASAEGLSTATVSF